VVYLQIVVYLPLKKLKNYKLNLKKFVILKIDLKQCLILKKNKQILLPITVLIDCLAKNRISIKMMKNEKSYENNRNINFDIDFI